MEELLFRIFGGYSFIDLIVFGFYILIGYCIRAFDETSMRDKTSSKTPKKWSWKFWYNDNYKRYIVTILSTFIFFRFYVEFIGHDLTELEALMIGLIGDDIGITAKERLKTFKKDRERFMEEMEE